MPLVDPAWLAVATVCAYLAVLVVPGALVGLAAGLRGWALAGLTPVLGYAVLGLCGPWLHLIGVRWTVASAAVATAAFVAVVFGLRQVYRRSRWGSAAEEPPLAPVDWTRNAHIAVAGCVVVAFAVSAVVIVGASEGVLDALFQRWDPVFHANGIRYISETGDGGLYGVSSVNRYGPEGSLFYPNAYHLAGSLVHMITGASVPMVLNGLTIPLAGIFALSMAALVRQCGGRAVFAGAAALTAAAATSGAYESVANGLVPFALSVALTPLGPLAVHRYVTRPSFDSGLVLVLASAGLLVVHSSALFGALIFTAPMLVVRWRNESGTFTRDLRKLVPIAVAGAIVTAPQLLGALGHATGSYGYRPWASSKPVKDALWSLLLFHNAGPGPQYVLAVLLLIGVLTIRRMGGLRWVGYAAVVFGLLWILVASFGGVSWVIAISRPWWNDHFRIFALAVIPLSLISAHGLSVGQRWLAQQVATRSEWARSHPRGTSVVGLVSAVVAIILLGVATNGFYAPANAGTVAHAYHKSEKDRAGKMGPITVTDLEIQAMHKMAEIAHPGERVLNDRNDGSVWLYAIAGVKSVAGHFDDNVPPPDAAYLADHFREYRTDPEVRAAVKRLDVHHVFVGDGSLFPLVKPDLGLKDLEQADFLREVYRNPDAVIYEITP